MQQYLDLLQYILDTGVEKSDRTGTGTKSIFGHQMRFDLKAGFPLLTTKKLHLKSIIHELLWFIQGDTNIKYLNDNGVKIWDAWAGTDGDCGPIYGHQWRHWTAATYVEDNSFDAMLDRVIRWRMNNDKEFTLPYHYKDAFGCLVGAVTSKGYASEYPFTFTPTHSHEGEKNDQFWKMIQEEISEHRCEAPVIKVAARQIDQLKQVIDRIKSNPNCRRLIVSAWNVGDIHRMALPPCHSFFQFGVSEGKLNCHLLMRSVDCPVGMPFNIASYALLTMMVAQVCNLEPGELVLSSSDTHIYLNQIDAIKEQLTRTPKSLPLMLLNPDIKNIDDFKYEDFTLTGYDPHPHIPMPVAV